MLVYALRRGALESKTVSSDVDSRKSKQKSNL